MSERTEESLRRIAIDWVLQLSARLVATLLTLNGLRIGLPDIESRFLAYLLRELRTRGCTNRVSAQMFGYSLRTLQRRALPISSIPSASPSFGIYDYIVSVPSTRTELLRRFYYLREDTVAAIIHDYLGNGTFYEEDGLLFADCSLPPKDREFEELVLAYIVNTGGMATRTQLIEELLITDAEATRVLDALVESNYITIKDEAQTPTYVLIGSVSHDTDSTVSNAFYASLMAYVKNSTEFVLGRLDRTDRSYGSVSTFYFDIDPDLLDSTIDELAGRFHEAAAQASAAIEPFASDVDSPTESRTALRIAFSVARKR